MLELENIFKSNILKTMFTFSLIDTIILLLLSFILGLFITWIYKKTFNGVMFSTSFSITLIGLCMITTFVILAVTSNVVLSLGMVGALSIVRFRAAIKEPLDIVFLFWSIAVGIVVGAGLISLAFVGSLLIGLILFLFSNRKDYETPYILVLNLYDNGAEIACLDILNKYIKKYKIKSKTINKSGVELILEVRIHNMKFEFMDEISKLSSIKDVVLLNYNGDYMS